ncbi:transmembrane protein 104 isoform X1 [Manis javanica]|uniref:transmembrane protein 104 isoform X1 n=2 Tax=Manis javanica TaxID=9974 RepID=UPI003C6D4F0B
MRAVGADSGQQEPAAAEGLEAVGAVARSELRCRCPAAWEGSRSSRRLRTEGTSAATDPSSLLEMAGEITETGELYSPYVGLVYMFNLIVGTGALTMPKAFATAGWLVSLVLLVFLGFMSFVTTTFVMEAMAAANAQLRWKRMENHQEEEEDDSSSVSDNDVLIQDNYEQAERRPILSVQRRGSPNLFEITDRVEMGQMASMFFSKVGVNLFYFCIIIYLYGDLAIYAAAVPFSLMQVTCSATGNDSCGVEANTKYNDTDQCWGPLRRVDAYRIYLAVFTLFLGPFTFFDVQKTKYLQILTSLMRWAAFAIMIVLALVRIGHGQGEGQPPLANLSGVRNLFGVCVYSFMCQHSLPSLITPVSSKRCLTCLVSLDYMLILAFYGLLSFTAIFCFRGDSLLDMYTLNFARCDIVGLAPVRLFLGLFPVFTISTNFPIIAVTLRNNWKTLFHREGGTYPWVVDRVVFPIITLVPPVLVAFCTHDLESLVGITGAYAGTGIQYVIPAFLVYLCRKDTELAFGYGTVNKHRSPFHHTFWVGFVLFWAFSCFFFVTANIVLSESKV